MAASALVVLVAAACADTLVPTDNTVATDELLVLGTSAGGAIPDPASFYVSNAHLTVKTLVFADAFNTTFVELRFPSNTLSSLNGLALTTTDSVLVTVTPLTDGYGFTVSPAGLQFTLSSTPTFSLSFARYGDLSVADGSATYANRTAYAGALDMWYEVRAGRWGVAKGSSVSGSGTASAALDQPGTYVVAAVK